MKKGIFLLIGLLSLTSISAKDINTTNNNIGVNYPYNDAVTFTERSVEFLVYLDGNFDFNTHTRNDRYYDYNGMRINSGVKIERDFRGRVRKVGAVFINYDVRGNVSRIGNVFMSYRFGQLSKVGHLKINYDRWGYPHFRGFVKTGRQYNNDYYYNNGLNININLGDVCEYEDAYFYKRDFRNNYRQFKEDNNYFYYKAVPNAKIGKRNKILKRKKPGKKMVKHYKKHQDKRIVKPEQKGRSKRNR
ncbi:hypothetical protein C7447_1051 [Tenacibaculum adriaticum]|uniref:Uncharacterized protein n=1 Tax=Tenacibaculum adriaticum TaxID=413713 RepID=A0A5S5DNP5_9FLAO|nr:hypothetical protein [Tenacibaculum adriaticum]TYP96988.1 hypothetical protein C7447_1051 [Tenacibaculum adriaticum]